MITRSFVHRLLHNDALRITAIFTLIGLSRIALRDEAAYISSASTTHDHYNIHALDGLYIFLTAIVAYWLVARLIKQRDSARRRVERALEQSKASAQHLTDLLAATSTILYALKRENGQATTTWVSGNVERVTGWTPVDTAEPGWWRDHIHPEDHEKVMACHNALKDSDEAKLEYRFLNKDGGFNWVLDEQRIFPSSNGEPARVVGALTNITQQKLAEFDLRNMKSILQAALDQSQSGIIIADIPSGLLRYGNASALRMGSAPRSAVVPGSAPESYSDFWPMYELDGTPIQEGDTPLMCAVRYGETVSREIILRRRGQEDRFLMVNAAPIANSEGNAAAAIEELLDITEIKRAASVISETDARFIRQRDALAALTDTRALVRDDLEVVLQRITEIAAEAMETARVTVWRYNLDATELHCVDLFDLAEKQHSSGFTIPVENRSAFGQAISGEGVIATLDARTDPRTMEYADLYVIPQGITSTLDAAIHLGGKLEGVVCFEHSGLPREWLADEKSFAVAIANVTSLAMEVRERTRAETRLRAAREELRRTASAGKVGLWDWEVRSGALHYSLQNATDQPLANDAIIQDHSDWVARIHPEDAERVLAYAANYIHKPDHPYFQEFRLRLENDTYQWILAQGSLEMDAEGNPLRILGSHVDITERKRHEAESIQAQKMESVGRLAGGVAHDFNNLLTVILGYSELALSGLTEDQPEYQYLAQIERASKRAANLTKQLLAFSRRQVMISEVLNLNEVILEAEQMLRRLIGEDIEFEIIGDEDLGLVVADPGQMEQVIMNLVINARDAMPMGGKILIETQNTVIDESITAQHPHLSPGNYVGITVSDNGAGMDAQTQAHIFEPFFTTKDADKGTGLGLSTVYGILKQSGGSIIVYSELGLGTSFNIYLPRAENLPVTQVVVQKTVLQTANDETILVVEDEESLRVLTKRFLLLAGYRVLTAANGADALAMLAQEKAVVDLLLSDVIMPGISGRELARQLAKDYPRLKVLYMSGYTDTALSIHGVLEKGTHLLNKPFSSTQLTQKIRLVLDTPQNELGSALNTAGDATEPR